MRWDRPLSGTSLTLDRLPPALLGLAVLASGAALAALQADLTFWLDEWDFLLHRRDFDADALLEPHNEHIAVLPVLLYKALLSSFGMDSQLPFQLPQIAAALVAAVLLFAYVRRRIGAWAAVAAVIPILFLGASWGNLLSAFQVAFFASMACGIAALLVFERWGRRGDPIVCALLVVAILWQSLGLTFVVGVAVAVALGPHRLRRAYVAAVPLCVYGIWWLGWGHEAAGVGGIDNLLASPGYVVDGFASSISALFGLNPSGPESEALTWGRPLLAVAVVLAALRLRQRLNVRRELVVVVVIAVSFWLLAALNVSVLREPTNGRYQYVGAVFVVMIAAELLRGMRIPTAALVVAYAVAIAAAVSGFGQLERNSEFLAGLAERKRGALAALEIARDLVDPRFLLTAQNSDVVYFERIDAGSYLSAVDAFGSPAYTQAELAGAPEPARVAADKATAAALGIGLRSRLPRPAVLLSQRCRERPPATGAAATFSLPEGGAVVLAPGDSELTLRMRRFAADSFPVELGSVAAHRSAELIIPEDRVERPWELEVTPAGPVFVCEHPALVRPNGDSR